MRISSTPGACRASWNRAVAEDGVSESAVRGSRRATLSGLGAVVFAATLSTVAGRGAPARASAAPANVHVITIEGMQFRPQALTVEAGQQVRWVNKDPFPHTATADGGAFDSREIASGGTWNYRPARAGELGYGCRLHPTMRARLIVQAPPRSRRADEPA